MEVRKLELSGQEPSSEAYLVQSPEKGRHDLIEVPTEEMQRLRARGRLRCLCFPGSPLGTSAASSLRHKLLTLHTRSLEKCGEEMPGVRARWAAQERLSAASLRHSLELWVPWTPSVTPPDLGRGAEAWAAQSCPVCLRPSYNALSLQVSAESW